MQLAMNESKFILIASRCDTFCAQTPGGDRQCPSLCPSVCPSAGWGHAQLPARCPRQICLPRECEQTPRKCSCGHPGVGGALPRPASKLGGGPGAPRAFGQQQRPWVRVTQHKELPLCHCWDGEQTLYRSHEGQSPARCHSPQTRGGFSRFTAPPTPKMASSCSEDLESSTPRKATAKPLPCRRGKSRWILLCLVHH